MGVERELVGELVVLHRKIEALLRLVYGGQGSCALTLAEGGTGFNRIREAERLASGVDALRVPPS